jgi:hypothetical protein
MKMSDCSTRGAVPACRCAHAGYRLGVSLDATATMNEATN